MIRLAALVQLLTLACTWAAPAASAETAESLLGRMMSAARELDYEGVFVYHRGDSLHTMRVVHRGSGPVEMEKLVSLTGPKREVIRNGSKVICKFADREGVLVEDQQPRNPMDFNIAGPLETLAALYRLELEGGDRVAGRSTHVVHVAPITPDRYGYRLWIDEDTGLLLKSVVIDREQRSLEQEQFAEVTVGVPIPDERFESELSGENFVRYDHDASGAARAQAPGSPVAASDRDWIVGSMNVAAKTHLRETHGAIAGLLPGWCSQRVQLGRA